MIAVGSDVKGVLEVDGVSRKTLERRRRDLHMSGVNKLHCHLPLIKISQILVIFKKHYNYHSTSKFRNGLIKTPWWFHDFDIEPNTYDIRLRIGWRNLTFLFWSCRIKNTLKQNAMTWIHSNRAMSSIIYHKFLSVSYTCTCILHTYLSNTYSPSI